MKTMTLAITLLFVTFLSSCATTPEVVMRAVKLESIPTGATLVCAGKSLGILPVTKEFAATIRPDGKLHVDASGCEAVWKSGVRKAFSGVTYDARVIEIGLYAQRPEVPGLESDLEFAKAQGSEASGD